MMLAAIAKAGHLYGLAIDERRIGSFLAAEEDANAVFDMGYEIEGPFFCIITHRPYDS